MIKIGITGSSGQMGRVLLELIGDDRGLELGAAFDVLGSEFVGQDAGVLHGSGRGILIGSDLREGVEKCDVLIDFTRPEGTLSHLENCIEKRIPLVIGTTGFSNVENQTIKNAAKLIPIVMSPNMSVGVNVLFNLVGIAADVLGESFDVEVIEAHHRKKVDAPSGTALRIGEVVAKAMGRDLGKDGVFARKGNTGARKAKTIGFATIRGGDIVGDHTALFAGSGERIEISHKAADRSTFARGAIRAAKFLVEKAPGFYEMTDVLGLDKINQ